MGLFTPYPFLHDWLSVSAAVAVDALLGRAATPLQRSASLEGHQSQLISPAGCGGVGTTWGVPVMPSLPTVWQGAGYFVGHLPRQVDWVGVGLLRNIGLSEHC